MSFLNLMRKISFSFLITFTFTVFAENPPISSNKTVGGNLKSTQATQIQNVQSETYTAIFFDKTEQIKIIKEDGLNISENCKNDLKKCEAFKATLKKPELPPNKTNLAGHPASKYCLAAKGKNIFLKNAKNQEYDYCLFSDNTYIDSWDLYYKFNKKEYVK